MAFALRDTCRLKVKGNCFTDNPSAVAQYSGEKGKKPTGSGGEFAGNLFWETGELFTNIPPSELAIAEDPQFADPENGHYASGLGSPYVDGKGHPVAGLSDPEPIKKLWDVWKKSPQEEMAR